MERDDFPGLRRGRRVRQTAAALATCAAALGGNSLATAQSFGPAGAIGPAIVEIGQGRDGRLTFTLSLTGAVSINQMEFTVYLRGHGPAAGSAGGGLTAIR